MGVRLQLAPHLPDEVLFRRYRSATRPVEPMHWQVLWMFHRAFTAKTSPTPWATASPGCASSSAATPNRGPRRCTTAGRLTRGSRPSSRPSTRPTWPRPHAGARRRRRLELNADVFQRLIDAFAEEQGVGKRKRILLVLHQAGWHGEAAREAVPEGITRVPLPSYSPELQPAEHLWPLIDEAVSNRVFESLGDLEAAIGARIRVLCARSEQIRSTCHFD